jgi:hypothetical protein
MQNGSRKRYNHEGGMITIVPEGYTDDLDALAKQSPPHGRVLVRPSVSRGRRRWPRLGRIARDSKSCGAATLILYSAYPMSRPKAV